jgi:hypothetical protein
VEPEEENTAGLSEAADAAHGLPVSWQTRSLAAPVGSPAMAHWAEVAPEVVVATVDQVALSTPVTERAVIHAALVGPAWIWLSVW